ncbi:MAG: Gx transporter family protein [Bacillota bacterium]|nr:Gx transporter family protein [Bacillota bacterium]
MNRKLSYIGVLSALAIVIGYLEQMIPMPSAVPGIKLGLSNIAVLLAFYKLDSKSAFGIAVIKAFACGLLFWGVGGLLYSLGGSIAAYLAMLAAQKIKSISVIGVSVLGAVAHNFGQLVVLFFMSGSFSFIYYICILGLAAVATGIITGIVAKQILRNLN